MKKELLEIQKELTESYKEKTSAEYILGVVSKKNNNCRSRRN